MMERKVKNNQTIQVNLQTLSALVSRNQLSATLGVQYGGSRDLYEALGYKLILTYADYLAHYDRQDIAKAVIDRPANATWQGELALWESSKKEDTDLEKEWIQLEKDLSLKDKFNRVDRLSNLGEYAILLLGLDDVKKKEDFKKPVSTSSKRKLLYVNPFGQGSAKIQSYVTDPTDSRFGHPEIYEVIVKNTQENATWDILVHHSRVIHVVYDKLESDICGIPFLRAIYNRLEDLGKIVGGDAEMFWRGARPGYSGTVDKDFQMTPTMLAALQDQIDEYEHDLRRFLVNEGVDLKALAQQIADPKNHVDIQIQMISAVTGIPKRILMGSERGELSSAQDSGEWKTYIKGRRETKAEPNVIRPFVDRCIKYKILPNPGKKGYRIKWDDVFAMSEKEKADVGRTRATAIREYTANPNAENVLPPSAFLEFCLGLDDDQIAFVTELVKSEKGKEKVLSIEEEELIKEEGKDNG